MWKKSDNRIIILTVIFFLMFFGVALNFLKISQEREYVRTAEENTFVTIHAGNSSGTIFDRNFVPLVNEQMKVTAIAVPSAVALDDVKKYAKDKKYAEQKYNEGKPFSFECTQKGEDSEGLTFFEIPERYGDNMTAIHVIGYLSEGKGASGLEYAYENLLRTGNVENSVTYSTDGFGHILIGSGKSVIRSEKEKSGVVTTIDREIQEICERAGRSLEKGAIVVSNVKNGDILGIVSLPEYDVNDIESALDDESSPMINRTLYSYSVGSIFKIVTSCEAINEGYAGFMSNCTGEYAIGSQMFGCHDRNGHGIQDMSTAITNSCNPYFISISQCLDIQQYRSMAYSMGFGREIHLCTGMTSSAGVLPSVDELLVPAELANFSFGQGKLTASPLQINQMTCAVANGGELVMLRLIRGITVDGETVGNEKSPLRSRVMTKDTAAQLRKMMIGAVYNNENTNAAPEFIRVGAKTSTAQTGRFDEDGEEYCHGWITGFFPSSSPRYAVTVLAEDGGYGNDTAAPVFREIVDSMMSMK